MMLIGEKKRSAWRNTCPELTRLHQAVGAKFDLPIITLLHNVQFVPHGEHGVHETDQSEDALQGCLWSESCGKHYTPCGRNAEFLGLNLAVHRVITDLSSVNILFCNTNVCLRNATVYTKAISRLFW